MEGGQQKHSLCLHGPEGETDRRRDFSERKRAMLQISVSVKANDLWSLESSWLLIVCTNYTIFL